MINKVILVGRLGKDPEVKYLEGGNVVAKITIATSEYYKDKEGNRQEQTEWHTCNAWGKLAEIAEKYLRKGSMVYIEGKLQTRSWDDKDGNKRYATEIRLNDFRMLDGKRDAGQSSTSTAGAGQSSGGSYSQPSSSESNSSAPSVGDDLPF